jgi:hypothetical protein
MRGKGGSVLAIGYGHTVLVPHAHHHSPLQSSVQNAWRAPMCYNTNIVRGRDLCAALVPPS